MLYKNELFLKTFHMFPSVILPVERKKLLGAIKVAVGANFDISLAIL
jgi:hypothetical protein